MTMSILSLLLVAFYYIQIVASRVEGPFALYTKSADPAWNMRVLSIGARNAYAFLTPPVATTSDIQASAINFYINTTSTLTPDAPYGNLVWGAQAPYSALSGRIDIVDVSSGVQPIFFDIVNQIQGYSTRWNFTMTQRGKKLLFNQQDRFYGKMLNTERYNADTVHWLFGASADGTGAAPITLWRYDAP